MGGDKLNIDHFIHYAHIPLVLLVCALTPCFIHSFPFSPFPFLQHFCNYNFTICVFSTFLLCLIIFTRCDVPLRRTHQGAAHED